MSDDYGSDYISVTDDDGNSFELEHLNTLELDDQLYMAFLPANMDEDSEDYGIILLKVIEEDGEELFGSIDDDQELDKVYDAFMNKLWAEDDPADSTEEK